MTLYRNKIDFCKAFAERQNEERRPKNQAF